jgi:hypothetical protein
MCAFCELKVYLVKNVKKKIPISGALLLSLLSIFYVSGGRVAGIITAAASE